MIPIRRVDNWRDGWKWGSVHFSTLSVLLNAYGAIALKGAATTASVLGLIPMRWALVIGALVSVSALISRFTTLAKGNGSDSADT